jgi:hypothetical protein
MGKMKELHTTGQDLQRQMAASPSFVPTFEELQAMQERYLELLRLSHRQPPGIEPRQ